MSRVRQRVAALEKASLAVGPPPLIAYEVLAAPDGGVAIMASMTPAERRALEAWCGSIADELVQACLAAAEGDVHGGETSK